MTWLLLDATAQTVTVFLVAHFAIRRLGDWACS